MASVAYLIDSPPAIACFRDGDQIVKLDGHPTAFLAGMINVLLHQDFGSSKSIHVLHEFFDPLTRSFEHSRQRTGHSGRNWRPCTIDVCRNPTLVRFSRTSKRSGSRGCRAEGGRFRFCVLTQCSGFLADGWEGSRQAGEKKSGCSDTFLGPGHHACLDSVRTSRGRPYPPECCEFAPL